MPLGHPLLLFSHHLPAVTLAVISTACRIWGLQTAGTRAMCTKGDLCTGVAHIAVSRKWPLLKAHTTFLLGSVSARGKRRGMLLIPDQLDYSLLFLSINVPLLQVKRGCHKEIYLQCSDLHSQWVWGSSTPSSSCGKCKCALPSFPALCQLSLTVQMIFF